jgi:hypothetical protein
LNVRVPVVFDFGQLISFYPDLSFTAVARYDTDTLLEDGFTLDGFAVDLDMQGIINMLLPAPGAANASENAIMVCTTGNASAGPEGIFKRVPLC